MLNGWKGRGTSVYKQGSVCFVSGQVYGGSNWNQIVRLPYWCRPKKRMIFGSSFGARAFRVDVTRGGLVRGMVGVKGVPKLLSLDGFAFDTMYGSAVPLTNGFKKMSPRVYAQPRARRMGALCMLSGIAFKKGKIPGLVGTAPSWCRPKARMVFATNIGSRIQRIDVLKNGQIRWTGGKASAIVNLTGIRYTVSAKTVLRFSARRRRACSKSALLRRGSCRRL